MLYLLLLLPTLAYFEDHKLNHKLCTNLNYCRRNRELSQKPSYQIRYFIPSDSITRHSNSVHFSIQSEIESTPFLKAYASLYSNNFFHLKIDEISPIRPRFHASDFINFTIPASTIEFQVTDSEIIWRDDEILYKIVQRPFKIEGFQSGSLIFVVNHKNLMNFERYRTKDNEPRHQEYNLVDATGLPGHSGVWEEGWQGHEDLNPNGPSSLGLDILLKNTPEVYGFPEHADNLALKDTTYEEPYRLFNVDIFEYDLNSRSPLYGAIPFIMSHCSAFFWNNPSDTSLDISTESSLLSMLSTKDKHIHFFSETGVIDLYIFIDSPMKIVQKLTKLTGLPPMPPLFSLGYHQSRYSYMTRFSVHQLEKNFREKDIPMDVVWLDIDHTYKNQYFIWDYEKFEKPAEMIESLAISGRKVVRILDPHVSADPQYFIYSELKEKGYFIKNSEGHDYVGFCWPGLSSWPDFLRKEVRDYWAQAILPDKYKDTTDDVFLWVDMNEPSVFRSPEMTMLKTNIHMNSIEHREMHNIYGLLSQQATYSGLELRNSNQRPFLLSRSFYAGSQKYGAVWTGDNQATWDHLLASIPMCLSMAISGISFCGADIGGFTKVPSEVLFARWYQLGVFLPFFRSHSHTNVQERNPWVFGVENMINIRNSIQERYKLIPYIYSLFFAYSNEGTPVIRPLFLQFPGDGNARWVDKEFMLGDALLVCALENEHEEEVRIYVPEGRWFDYFEHFEVQKGFINYKVSENHVPVLAKGGTIVPIQWHYRKSTKYMTKDPYRLLVFLDGDEYAIGRVYIDDFSTLGYKNREYLLTSVEFKKDKLELEVLNYWKAENIIEEIVVIGARKNCSRVWVQVGCGKNEAKFELVNEEIRIKPLTLGIDLGWKIYFEYNE